MALTLQDLLQIDLPALLAALFACVANALVGNYLVLRRQSLLGDAVSHAVLPGIVGGFLVSGTRTIVPMFAGSLAAAVIAGVLIEAVRRIGRLEAGAAMGVVFTVMFALGVVLIEQSGARAVDLDAECVLFGQLEDIVWVAATTPASLLHASTWADFPREVVQLAAVTALIALVIVLFWKELRITAFDPALATTLGIPAGLFHYGLVVLTAIAAIASFEAVGSILVIAMLICPPATARLLTDRLATQVWMSAGIGVVCAVLGYGLAAFGPLALGHDNSLSAAGMIAVVGGVLLAAAALFGPHHGILGKRRQARRIKESPVAA
ncbi:MAG TPA: metal ABC transporter permease [Azospirillaceae bacterium]|nr:metal ABC transporter permease [Azospirillaceae bacterium]